MQIDQLIHARWIIPVRPRQTVYENYTLAINKGRIIELLASQDARQKYTADQSIDLDQHVLLPGLINPHTHAAMNLLRGYADDLALMPWLQEHIWPAEAKWVNPEFVYDGVQLACAEMLRGGTTCFADMYFFPQQTAAAANDAHMRACIGLIIIDFPSAWAQNADDYIHKGLDLHDELRNRSLLTTMFAPHAPYSVSDDPLKRIAVLNNELDLPIQMHIHETRDEIEQSLQACQQRPIQRLEQLGLLTPRLLGVHMTQLTDEEIQIYAQSGAQVIHCPESNLKLASGFCPVQKLLDANINVALATDGAASNNDLDMFGEMRSAALLGKAIADDAAAVNAMQVLEMATINGAQALNLEDEIGSLENGKAADIIAVNMGELETLPLYNPISQLVYAASRQQVSDVWVAGRHVMADRELKTIDAARLKQKTLDWQKKIKK